MIHGIKDTHAFDVRPVEKSFTVGGRNFKFQSGKVALFADGADVITDDRGNYLLTTVGISKTPKKDCSWFPMMVDYQEKYYATGKIGGNRFQKREGRPSDLAVLTSRLIDRPIRPMFPKGVVNEVQVISTIMSSADNADFGFWGITGASLALLLSGAKEFEGPVAGVRIAQLADGSFKFDPTFEDLKTAKLDLTVAGTLDAVTMVESQAQQVADEDLMKGFEFAYGLVKQICQAQLDFVADYKKTHEIREFTFDKREPIAGLKEKVVALLSPEVLEPLYFKGKLEFHDQLEELNEIILEKLGYVEDTAEIKKAEVEDVIYGYLKKVMRKGVLEGKKRLDGRKLGEVRPVRGEYGILPMTHGSALFQRGVTQALSIATLGGPGDLQIVDGMFEEYNKRYLHHYNFPPFSVGEVKPLRGTGRREVGHGRLAEKALEPVLPSEASFPYMMRVVSEVTTCNGSSSMASVCGSTMALMDAGVPITGLVTGVAMGMIYDEETHKYEVLTDIQAQEDFLGDLDFKVAGTKNGVTALQMDCKIAGLKLSVVADVLKQSQKARAYIEAEMTKELAAPRPQVSPKAPAIMQFDIVPKQIGELIGKGGETIQMLCRDFKVEIDVTDEGRVSVTAKNKPDGQKCVDYIMAMLKPMSVGDTLTGKVGRVLEGVGAIVEFGAKKSGMIHISKLANKRIAKVEDVLNVGDEVTSRVYAIDMEKGKTSLERISGGSGPEARLPGPTPDSGAPRGSFGDRGPRRDGPSAPAAPAAPRPAPAAPVAPVVPAPVPAPAPKPAAPADDRAPWDKVDI